MSRNPFVPPFEQLPETLPIFPLPGAILMPGNELPLNIFEPRYLNMVSDALSSHRMIGMIQPEPGVSDEKALCRTGCAGRITQYRETNDGRIEMVLSGICRFDIGTEIPTTRGYRLIIPDWSRFGLDYNAEAETDANQKALLTNTLKRFFELKQINADWSTLETLSAQKLTNTLIMALPIDKENKQELIETVSPEDRLYNLVAILGAELHRQESTMKH